MKAQHLRIHWSELEGFSGIEEADKVRWKKCCPRVNQEQEMKEADLYLRSSGKRYKRYSAFLTNWFRRKEEDGGSVARVASSFGTEAS